MPVNIKTIVIKNIMKMEKIQLSVTIVIIHKDIIRGMVNVAEPKDNGLYPNLKSPDYAFQNDYFERIKYTKEFKKRMAPIKITI